MKEGWEYKKLGEVCDRVSNIKWQNVPSDAVYSYVDLTAVDRDSLNITETQSINNENAPSRAKQIIKENDVLFGTTRPTLKRFCIVEDKNDGNICSTGFCVLRPNNKIVSSKWVFYQLMADKFYAYIEPLQSGAAYPAVTDGIVKSYIIPIPSLSEQQHIVEELDLLSSIIEKKKAQLNELDNLAQSLFYEMFGDPITNEKGWEKKCLSELCGRVNNIRWQEVLDEKTYNYVDLTAVDRTSHCIEETTMIKKGDAPSRAKQIIRTNDVLFGTTRPTLKRVCLVNKEYNDSICSTGFCVLRPLEDFVSSKWLFHLLLSNSFYSYIEPLQSGASYPAVSDNIVKSFSACIPPIILQNQFASKIEAIEHQKELIKKSIKEVETLFSSRMDYYFI